MNAGAKVDQASAASVPAPLLAGAPVHADTQPVRIILWAICLAHFLNDLLQSLLVAIFPLLKETYNLDFAQIGYIVLAFQLTASLLQPGVGYFTDKRPMPFGLAIGMCATLVGLIMLAYASNYAVILIAAALVGTGSSIFHPEGSRVTRMASGGRHGTAQSIFQVGGNFGQAAGPLLAAFIIVPLGQRGLVWFAIVAVFAIIVLARIGVWYKANIHEAAARTKREVKAAAEAGMTPRRVALAIGILLALMFSKAFYGSALSTFYTFYLIETFGVSLRNAQLFLFLYMAAVAVGVYFGGPLGDRVGRKNVIWFSILGALPFTIALPYVNLAGVAILSVLIGLIMAASMSQILVYGLELAPRKVGTMAGLFFGFSFGMGGLGAAVLGHLADVTSLSFVFKLSGFLPLLGLLCWFLPNMDKRRASA
ncbi:MAG: MFS transporter [Beijerinckiaceae bacterium]|nr:MFS transporter [Beijerinckiaceae bacterium]